MGTGEGEVGTEGVGEGESDGESDGDVGVDGVREGDNEGDAGTEGEPREGETKGGDAVGETEGERVTDGVTGIAGSGDKVGVGERVGSVGVTSCASPNIPSSEQTLGYKSHRRLIVVSTMANPSAPITQRESPPALAPPSSKPVPTINETISVSTPEPPQGCYVNFRPGERKLGN